jgi:DNA-nicking Smr family endonuclease
MGMSEQDQQLWAAAMKHVQPLHVTHTVNHAPLAEKISRIPHSRPAHHTWDLHGMALGEGYQFSLDKIHAQQGNYKFVTFITGKSGQMNQEFVQWLDNNPHVRKVEPVNNGGAYRVWFRKTR